MKQEGGDRLKVLFLQEFLKEQHIKLEPDGSFKNVFMSTDGGKLLKQLATDKTGLGLTNKDFYIDYAFYEVPKVTQTDNRGRATKYKPVSQKEAKPHYISLNERIVKEKPDIIIPSGNLGCKALLGKASISTMRGVPQKITVVSEEDVYIETINIDGEDESGWVRETKRHTCWVLPTYSMDYLLVNPKIQNLIEADFGTLKKFVDEGEDAFLSKDVKYEDVKTIERVREIFEKEVIKAPVTAWDLETNTLHPERLGAKPLVLSLCWKEGTGATIPLQHKEWTWLPGHLAEIYEYIKKFLADENIIKVAHNGKYDQKFLRLTKGFTEFKNCRDTKTMYYLLVNQDVKGSLRLSDLTYEFTDLGGYDKALEDYKKQYIEDYIERDKQRIAQEKLEWNTKCAEDKKANANKIREVKEHYKNLISLEREELKKVKKQIKKYEKDEESAPQYLRNTQDMIERNIDTLAYERDEEVNKYVYVKPPTPVWDKPSKPKNEIDGSDFNYEWIPLWDMLSPYASGDVDVCLRIYNQLASRCTKKGLSKLEDLYTGHYPDLVNVLAKIEATGVKLDIPYVKSLVEAYTKEEQRLLGLMRKFPEVKQLEAEKEQLYQYGIEESLKPKGHRDEEVVKLRNKYKEPEDRLFNPNSSDDKQKIMFKYTGLKLPYNREYLVDSAVEDDIPEEEIEWYHYKSNSANMKYIAKNHEDLKELAELLVEFSLVKTRKQNFTYKFLDMVDHNDLLHGSLNSEGTETSRLSSSSP